MRRAIASCQMAEPSMTARAVRLKASNSDMCMVGFKMELAVLII
jgi:hypothetical protein